MQPHPEYDVLEIDTDKRDAGKQYIKCIHCYRGAFGKNGRVFMWPGDESEHISIFGAGTG